MKNESLNLEIWDRLIQGKSLEGLPLSIRDGRIDLSCLQLPDPSLVRKFQFNGTQISEIEPGAIVIRAKWENLDFSGSKLNGLRLMNCDIVNCRFDGCQLEDLRLWSSKISDTSFCGANLRSSSLGGVQDGRRNVFAGVNFTDADLRQTVYKAASFERCIFRNSRLEKIDFQTSTFSECQFEGKLLRVLFYRRGFKGEMFPENEMRNIDFRFAKLRFVEFRGLSLDHVLLPNDTEHIVVHNYTRVLDKVIATLQSQSDMPGKKLAAYFGVLRKWAAPNQGQGVINIEDLAEITSPKDAELARSLLLE